MSKAHSHEDEAGAAEGPPPASNSRWLSRHGSLRQAAGQLSRRLAARLSLTRQRSLGGALGRRDADTDADEDDCADTDGDPYEAANLRAPQRLLPSPVRFSLPKATSSYDGFPARGRLLSTPHQRSCDSHDESVASATSAAGSSRGSSGDCGAAWACSGASKMDMMNFGKKPDEPDEDDKKDDASIKGLWKRAFNTLKIRDKEKTPKKKKGGKDDDDAADDVDPVYSLLKRAADKGVQKCTGCTPDSGGSPLAASLLQAAGKSGGGDSMQGAASSSAEIPLCRGDDCPCLCHNPLQLLVPSITLNDLKPRPKVRKGKSRSKSLAQTPLSPQSPQSPQSLPSSMPPPTPPALSPQPQEGGRARMASLRETGGQGRQKLV